MSIYYNGQMVAGGGCETGVTDDVKDYINKKIQESTMSIDDLIFDCNDISCIVVPAAVSTVPGTFTLTEPHLMLPNGGIGTYYFMSVANNNTGSTAV